MERRNYTRLEIKERQKKVTYLEYVDEIVRAKKRIEFLRQIYGLRKQDIYRAMGFSRQHYHQQYHNSSTLSVKALIGITHLYGISEQDLLHSTENEFKKLPIVKAYLDYSKALTEYEKLKLGVWACEPFIEIT